MDIILFPGPCNFFLQSIFSEWEKNLNLSAAAFPNQTPIAWCCCCSALRSRFVVCQADSPAIITARRHCQAIFVVVVCVVLVLKKCTCCSSIVVAVITPRLQAAYHLLSTFKSQRTTTQSMANGPRQLGAYCWLESLNNDLLPLLQQTYA